MPPSAVAPPWCPVHHRITETFVLLKESRMTVTNWTAALLPDLTGIQIIVTGATSGLGKATADALARAGAHVVLAVRNPRQRAGRSGRHRGRHRGP